MSGFEDRINENSTEFEKEFLKNYDGNLWTALEKMKNWQPPKPQQYLPVVPSFVAEWIEYVKGKDNNVTALLTDFDNMSEDVDEWLFLQSNDDNINLILRAWLDGYTVEKNIVSPCPVCGYENVKSNFCSICGRKNDYE